MSVDAYISEPFVFQAFFVDSAGVPIVVLGPNLTVFRFDPTTGDREVLVSAEVMTLVVPSDPGRYVYVYTIPSDLDDGTVLYAEARGTDPVSGDTLLISFALNLKSRDIGLRARFVE